MTTATDLNAIRAKICSMILASNMAEFVENRERFELTLTNPSDGSRFWTFINATFANFGTEMRIEVSLVAFSSDTLNILPYEEDQDQLIKNKLEVNINYPCHGGTNIDLVQKRFEFYQQVMQLAAEINQLFCKMTVYVVVSTAAQRKERKEKRAAEEREAAINQWVVAQIEKLPRSMKSGSKRSIVDDMPDFINVGLEKTWATFKKSYKLTVHSKNSVEIERTQ